MNKKNDIQLNAKNIVMDFGGLKALDNVNISINKNQILGLIGPNGSGKTTFFNVITGIYEPSKGEIFFEDENIVGKTPQEIAKKGIIRTFQSSRLWFDLTIIDNLFLGMYMRRKSGIIDSIFNYKKVKEDFISKSEEALETLAIFNAELSRNCYKITKNLSLIDRRRVEICRAILANPRLLLLDEPSAGMDVMETKQLMDDIKKMKEKKENLGIIIIEHDMEVISSIADNVIVLNFGKKLAEGKFGVIIDNPKVREAYLGK